MPDEQLQPGSENGPVVSEPVREASNALGEEGPKREREDREEADASAALEQRVVAQTARIVELEKKWKDLDEREPARQIEHASWRRSLLVWRDRRRGTEREASGKRGADAG